MSDVRKLNGSLLLDYETCKTAPNLFALLALMLRTAGMKVFMMGPLGAESAAAKMGIAFNDYFAFPQAGYPMRDARQPVDAFKFATAAEALKAGPVLWPDLSFDGWTGPGVDKVEGLIILNWKAVAQSGGFGGVVASHA